VAQQLRDALDLLGPPGHDQRLRSVRSTPPVAVSSACAQSTRSSSTTSAGGLFDFHSLTSVSSSKSELVVTPRRPDGGAVRWPLRSRPAVAASVAGTVAVGAAACACGRRVEAPACVARSPFDGAVVDTAGIEPVGGRVAGTGVGVWGFAVGARDPTGGSSP